jgi:hypothetical protein
MVLATLQQNRRGVWIQSAVPSPAADSFTVYLNRAVRRRTIVAYMILS